MWSSGWGFLFHTFCCQLEHSLHGSGNFWVAWLQVFAPALDISIFLIFCYQQSIKFNNDMKIYLISLTTSMSFTPCCFDLRGMEIFGFGQVAILKNSQQQSAKADFNQWSCKSFFGCCLRFLPARINVTGLLHFSIVKYVMQFKAIHLLWKFKSTLASLLIAESASDLIFI